MNQVSTIFLRGVVYFLGVVVLATCVFALPSGINHPDAGGYRLLWLGLYAPAIPFFVALYHTLKLLQYIDTNKAFSDLSVAALKYIKYCAVTIGAMFAVGLPYIHSLTRNVDPPAVIAIPTAIIFASLVIAVFAAVLQKLLRAAIDIKNENDLTV